MAAGGRKKKQAAMTTPQKVRALVGLVGWLLFYSLLKKKFYTT